MNGDRGREESVGGIDAPGGGPGGARPDVPAPRQIHLDVREDIRRGQEPFARIIAAARSLEPDMALVLRAPFEPMPLYAVLAARGLSHWTERRADDDWSVWFYRAAESPGAGDATAPPRGTTARPGAGPGPMAAPAGGEHRDAANRERAGETVAIDVRGLEPPLPLIRILEAVERMAPGDRLEILHERRPMFLYPQLDARGLVHETDQPGPGLVRIVVRRGPDAP
jgi:uncharacterized protein (DUF2249 family)